MKNQYFVKFVRYNEHTISNLINKAIKFSTVYEFNDTNELHYISPFPNSITDNMQTLIKEKITDKQHKLRLINNIKKGNYRKDFINELCEYIYNYSDHTKPPQEYIQCILETMAYSSVGIFCLSSIDVFMNDSAHLMFAHYAENSTGLALIYEANKAPIPTCVNYANNNKKPSSSGEPERILAWDKGEFNDMDDFLNKSKKWNYEMEHRLFNTPGVKSTDSIILKAILHTKKFNDENKKQLLTINKENHDNKITIKEIAPSTSNYSFTISDNNYSVYDWLLSQVKMPCSN